MTEFKFVIHENRWIVPLINQNMCGHTQKTQCETSVGDRGGGGSHTELQNDILLLGCIS